MESFPQNNFQFVGSQNSSGQHARIGRSRMTKWWSVHASLAHWPAPRRTRILLAQGGAFFALLMTEGKRRRSAVQSCVAHRPTLVVYFPTLDNSHNLPPPISLLDKSCSNGSFFENGSSGLHYLPRRGPDFRRVHRRFGRCAEDQPRGKREGQDYSRDNRGSAPVGGLSTCHAFREYLVLTNPGALGSQRARNTCPFGFNVYNTYPQNAPFKRSSQRTLQTPFIAASGSTLVP